MPLNRGRVADHRRFGTSRGLLALTENCASLFDENRPGLEAGEPRGRVYILITGVSAGPAP